MSARSLGVSDDEENWSSRYGASVSPDPGDDKFYAAALESRVTSIVTANPRHFPAHEGVLILSPDEALRELDECGAR